VTFCSCLYLFKMDLVFPSLFLRCVRFFCKLWKNSFKSQKKNLRRNEQHKKWLIGSLAGLLATKKLTLQAFASTTPHAFSHTKWTSLGSNVLGILTLTSSLRFDRVALGNWRSPMRARKIFADLFRIPLAHYGWYLWSSVFDINLASLWPPLHTSEQKFHTTDTEILLRKSQKTPETLNFLKLSKVYF
jgi:hypothetical protein